MSDKINKFDTILQALDRQLLYLSMYLTSYEVQAYDCSKQKGIGQPNDCYFSFWTMENKIHVN